MLLLFLFSSYLFFSCDRTLTFLHVVRHAHLLTMVIYQVLYAIRSATLPSARVWSRLVCLERARGEPHAHAPSDNPCAIYTGPLFNLSWVLKGPMDAD